jgi:predicted TPR repeat methyltransferase
MARLAERRGDTEGALAHLRRAWGLTPTDVRLLNRISEVAEAAGESGDARLALRRAAELAPDSAAQAARLVDFELRHGLYMEAALDLGRFLDRFPTDPTLLRLADRLQRDVTR